MKTFKVVLTRDYILKIKAKNERQAKNFADRFISRSIDIPDKNETENRKFQIIDIDEVTNDIFGSMVWEVSQK